MKHTINNSSSGIGFVGLLTILFVALKLLDKIDWSWGWVLSPLWIAGGLVIIVLFIFAICFLIYKILKK